MQIHPGPYTLPWHTTDNSDLSMQWGQLSRPYSSTDRSSSLGSMESLDQTAPAARPYSDSHNSPVDPVLFNNKRDSAYSSFSASSNTSDYATVPLRPGEACSMDNLLQSLGPACKGYPCGDTSTRGLKSRSLTRPKVRPDGVKERPASCCYEEEMRGGEIESGGDKEGGVERKMNPPQPPTRKDSFRATRSRPGDTDKRCVSAPVGIPSRSSYRDDEDDGNSPLNREPGIRNGYPSEPTEISTRNGNFKEDSLESYYNIRTQRNGLRNVSSGSSSNKDYDPGSTTDHHHLSAPVRSSPLPVTPSIPSPLPPDSPMENQAESQLTHPENKHSSSGMHSHSAPEKLLAAQLQVLQFNGDSVSSSLEPSDRSNPSDPSMSPCSGQWSPSSLQPTREELAGDLGGHEASHDHLHAPQNKWGGSRCSTPGSVFMDGDGEVGDLGERLDVMEVVTGGSLSPIQHHHPWGRSVSVPVDPAGCSGGVSSDRVLERDFGPLSAAASVDSLLEEQRGGGGGKGDDEGEVAMKKSNSRNHRRNRRRSERFATNLRNEIQRKKAQLQKSRSPGGLLYSGETVQEEEGPDLHEEAGEAHQHARQTGSKIRYLPPVSPLEVPNPGSLNRFSSASSSNTNLDQLPTTAPAEKSHNPHESSREGLPTQTESKIPSQNPNHELSGSVQTSDPGAPSFGVGIRVVEEPAPAGKARRWRWTPEHKLQPEPEPERRFAVRGERSLGVTSTGSRHGVCAFTSAASSSTRSSSTSRMEESDILPFADRMKFFEETSRSVSVSNLSGLTSRRQRRQPHLATADLQGGQLGQSQAQRRYSYQGGLQQENALLPNTMEARRQSVSSSSREREREREMEERVRERQREERARERERQREREREERERERELESERARLREMEKEREREERMREWERERERELELERERERERELEREREMERAREKERLELERRREMELEREREREREEEKERQDQLTSTQEYYSRNQDLQHRDNLHNHQAQNQAPRSAFYPVNTPCQPQENQQPLHQGYTPRSYTPTETYPARQQETAKLDRKYSLTERDYPRWRREPLRPPESPDQHQQQSHQGRWGPGQSDGSNNDPRGSPFAPPPAPLSLRGRAMSENDLRFIGSHRWSPSLSVGSGQMLSELEEGGGGGGEAGNIVPATKKKTPPPPRPPPPKWEQFHRRRASHHTLFASPPLFSYSSSSTPPPNHSVPPSFTPAEGHHPSHAPYSTPPPEIELSRQRSYSLPPQKQEGSEGCRHCNCGQSQPQVQQHPFTYASSNQNQPQVQECPFTYGPSNQNQPPVQEHPFTHATLNQNQAQIEDRPFTIAPPSPMFSRRAFRPVAPPHRERDGISRSGYGGQQERVDMLPPLPPPSTTEDCSTRLSEVKPYKHQQSKRAAAEWERTPSPRVHSSTSLPVIENGAISPESYFAMSYEQQQQLQNSRRFQNFSKNTGVEPQKGLESEPDSEPTLSPSPAHSLEAELDIPMETDIDDFQEEEGLPLEGDPITSELQCFALPVMVLETDIDTLPDSETSPSGRMRAESGSLEEELEVGERTREGITLDELFPQSSEGESGTESWRGAYRTTEDNSDSLDRRSGASSSCSSYYSTSAAKAQLLSQMKDVSDSRERDDDDELSYKKQLMESLRKKLGVLREAQRGLQDDIRANTQLGEEVESMVVAVCKPNEVDKFRMFIGDLDKVVSLLLSLSGRLLRVESSLDTLDPDTEHHERLPLLEKKRQLMRQLSEAQDLKDHVDRREQAVGRVLARCLSPEHHRDYSHFVKMKAALLVEQRQLEDKIRLGEEQLRGLRESLGLGLGMGLGMSMMSYGHY